MPNDQTLTANPPEPNAVRSTQSAPSVAPARSARMLPAAGRAAQRWMLAALIAPALAVLAATGGPWQALPPVLSLMFAVGCGWAVVLLLAPWRTMRDLHPDRPAIRELVDQVRNITEGHRDIPIEAMALDRRDEIGDLSRLLRDLTAEVIDNRRQARWLRKSMGDSIRRETDKATAHLQRQVNTDPLTGLGNRRTLEQGLDELTQDAADHARLLTAMAIDLDQFKPINDALGHEVGDQCLTFLAHLLRSVLRPEDTAIRLGGDEFIALMPDVPLELARSVAERLRSLHAQMPWPHRQVARPTLSIGLSCAMTGSLANPMDLVREADAALYESKRRGRAMTTVFGPARSAA